MVKLEFDACSRHLIDLTQYIWKLITSSKFRLKLKVSIVIKFLVKVVKVLKFYCLDPCLARS